MMPRTFFFVSSSKKFTRNFFQMSSSRERKHRTARDDDEIPKVQVVTCGFDRRVWPSVKMCRFHDNLS